MSWECSYKMTMFGETKCNVNEPQELSTMAFSQFGFLPCGCVTEIMYVMV